MVPQFKTSLLRSFAPMLVLIALAAATAGCSMFGGDKANKERTGPKTVEEWIDQDRVKF